MLFNWAFYWEQRVFTIRSNTNLNVWNFFLNFTSTPLMHRLPRNQFFFPFVPKKKTFEFDKKSQNDEQRTLKSQLTTLPHFFCNWFFNQFSMDPVFFKSQKIQNLYCWVTISRKTLVNQTINTLRWIKVNFINSLLFELNEIGLCLKCAFCSGPKQNLY